MASNAVNGKQESNQLEVRLILSKRSMLERSTSKSDGNIGDEVKFGQSEDVHFPGAAWGRSITGSIYCKAHEEDVVKEKLELTEYNLDELEKKQSSLRRKMITKKTTEDNKL